MAIHALLVLLLTSVAGAVEIFGSNLPLVIQGTQLTLIWEAPQGTLNPLVDPLTMQAGRFASPRSNSNVKGSFKSVTTNGANAGSVNQGDIVLVSCDATNSSFLSQDAVLDLIVPKNPTAIVLYSLTSPHCGIKDVGTFTHYYTLRNVTANTMQMLASSTSANATIRSETETDTQPSTRNQTPAVAMSVLYAVTGIVTVLFLVIITTGAWRAHNNPGRYGPRTGIAGHPRQSRAKGLAKAMLETLPIVKFGDPLPSKAENRDIELDETNASEESKSTVPVKTDSDQKPNPQGATAPVAPDIATSVPKPDEPGSTSQPETETSNEHLGCSICTEDFAKGEDVRVLPCNHQYHPACIDPWLLNVSGTCPLCRVDLRPVRSNLSADEPSSPTDADPMPAVPAEAVYHSRVQRILATRHAPVHERIAILRQLARESGQQQPTDPTSSAAPADGSRNRLSLADRLRDRFSVRTRSGNAHDETSAPTTSATETTANTTTATSPSAPGANTTSTEAPPRP
ncbi:hypothetical protein V495_06848 [Pseudogymnoascus sp. VKM F-4514 (FW-929)]|nr:hypothetical protein V495_06848 [Pseudogymnoascus sp. VKM F-4514 (FW-929)]KFY67562.1 hypothetical protein V497_00341 [Pseudogymnoascus sp. VKM F-4516 (FW-969)]